MVRVALMGAVFATVIMEAPWPSVKLTALLEGRSARQVTATAGTADHCHSALDGLLRMLKRAVALKASDATTRS